MSEYACRACGSNHRLLVWHRLLGYLCAVCAGEPIRGARAGYDRRGEGP